QYIYEITGAPTGGGDLAGPLEDRLRRRARYRFGNEQPDVVIVSLHANQRDFLAAPLSEATAFDGDALQAGRQNIFRGITTLGEAVPDFVEAFGAQIELIAGGDELHH